jgi:hypothetical protein
VGDGEVNIIENIMFVYETSTMKPTKTVKKQGGKGRIVKKE